MSFREAEAELHDAARRATGLEDFGDAEYLEGLRALLHSLDEESSLNAIGEQTLRGMITDALASRLFSEQGWAELKAMHGRVVQQMQLAMSVFVSRDVEIARRLLSERETP